MSLKAKKCLALFTLVPGFLVLCACSKSAPPQPGTPAFYWTAAKETFAAGDYVKTNEHLDNLLLKDTGEYGQRAVPWSLILTSGMAAGYMEVADAYQKGVKANRTAPTALVREMNVNRSLANRTVLQFADELETYGRNLGEMVPLYFSFPKGTAAEVPLLLRVGAGAMLPASDVAIAQRRALERNVILAVCRAVGAPNDTAKAEQILAAPGAKVQRATFQLAMANALYDVAQLYSRDRMYDAEKLGILCERAKTALKGLPQSETKELTDKIERTVKALPKKS